MNSEVRHAYGNIKNLSCNLYPRMIKELAAGADLTNAKCRVHP